MHLLVRDIQLHPVRDTEPGRGDISRSAWIPGSNTAALPSFQRTCDPSAGTDSSVNVSGRKGTGRKEKEAFLSTYWMLGAFRDLIHFIHRDSLAVAPAFREEVGEAEVTRSVLVRGGFESSPLSAGPPCLSAVPFSRTAQAINAPAMSPAAPEGLRVAAAVLLWEEEGVAKGKTQGKFEMGEGAPCLSRSEHQISLARS